MVVIFGMVMFINNTRGFYDYDLDEYLSQEDFIQKIKDDELWQEHGENLNLHMVDNGDIGKV